MRPRSTTRSRCTGKAAARPRLDGDGVAVLEPPHVQLADGGPAVRPVRHAVDDEAAHAADALPAVESNTIGASPFAMSLSLTTSSISRNDMSGETSSASYGTIRPAAERAALPPHHQLQIHVGHGRNRRRWRRFQNPVLAAQSSRRTQVPRPVLFVAALARFTYSKASGSTFRIGNAPSPTYSHAAA